ncbi:MAG: hypothetical protein OXN84_16175 [Albidovulum sp.]|nr:hypothetical protein [Albidovulum sp.]
MKDTFSEQLSAVIREYESAINESRHDDASDVLAVPDAVNLLMRCFTAISRVSGLNSPYARQLAGISDGNEYPYYRLPQHIGVAKALLSDIKNGYLESLEELTNSATFADFLEMADHLLEKGYKDPAAVLAGGTLEAHLKKLCAKHGLKTRTAGQFKSADRLNADLKKAGAYQQLDQKSVTAWLGLRNHAAHGNYSEYGKDQVQLLVANVRDFIRRYPA